MRHDQHGITAVAEGPMWREWRGDDGVLVASLFSYARRLEEINAPHYDRMWRAGYLYDPADPAYSISAVESGEDPFSNMQENVIAQSADTLAASLSQQIRVRFSTINGSWSEQRRARRLEAYADGIDAAIGEAAAIRIGDEVKWSFLKGLSLVYVDVCGKSVVRRHIPAEQVMVDPLLTRDGMPSQMFMVELVDRAELKMSYPKAAKKIDAEDSGRGMAQFMALANNRGQQVRGQAGSPLVAVLRAWSLPVGNTKGRYVVATEHAILSDEEWKESFFPFSKLEWSRRENEFFPISGAERVEGHQRELNRRNWVISTALDHQAAPVTYVGQADANIAVRSVSRYGAVAVINGNPPVTVDHKAVSAETYASREAIALSAFREIGGISLAAQQVRPPGIESGVGLREYHDQKSERHALQQAQVEQHAVRILWLTLWCCKRLGVDAPKIPNRRKFPAFSKDEIEWADVDMGDVRVQMSAASSLPRTPSGMRQMVVELAQAGAITTEEFRRLIDHPDLEREMSLYNAAIEKIEYAIEAIANGAVGVTPSPTDHLRMVVVRAQRQLGIWETIDGAPEEVLDELRDYISKASWMLEQAQAQVGAAGAPGADPAAIASATGMPPAQPA